MSACEHAGTCPYPDKATTIETLLEVGRLIAAESSAEHPEDIAYAITNAVEHAAITLMLIHRRLNPVSA